MLKKWLGIVLGAVILIFSSTTCFAASPAAENAAKKVASQITNGSMTDAQKLLAIHDWICENVSYDYSFSSVSGTLDGPMLYGKAICAGYAEAFKAMSEACGIPCNIVLGTADNGDGTGPQPHGWNEVCINGEYLYIDVTWDDMTEKNGTILHDCFLINSYAMDSLHDRTTVMFDGNGNLIGRSTVPDEAAFAPYEVLDEDAEEEVMMGITVSGYVYMDDSDWGGPRLKFDTPLSVDGVTMSYIELGEEEGFQPGIFELEGQHVTLAGDLFKWKTSTAKANYVFFATRLIS